MLNCRIVVVTFACIVGLNKLAHNCLLVSYLGEILLFPSPPALFKLFEFELAL